MYGAPSRPKRVLLLTGAPGAGKTTLITRLAQRIGPATLGGFTTVEVRESGHRTGFRLTTFDGESRIIAHHELDTGYHVGSYGVDVAAIDSLANRVLDPSAGWPLYMVDEIGKMECLAPRFRARIRELIGGECPLIATIAQRGGGLIAEVKQRPDAELWTIDRENHRRALDFAAEWLRRHGINA